MDDDNRDDDPASLFRQAMRGVKRLHSDQRPPERILPRPLPRQRQRDERQIREDMLSDHYDPTEVETGEELLYVRPGVQHAVLRKLRRGYYSIQAELDLHGLFVPEARAAVATFLHECRDYRVQCARVIHGKGHGSHQKQPILKTKLNNWLRQHDSVLAFCSARGVDGGTGAVYVLLKRGR